MSTNTHTTTIDLSLPLLALASLVTILLAVAKFSSLLAIPWLWVFSPFWLPVAAGLSVGLLIMAISLLVTLVVSWLEGKNLKEVGFYVLLYTLGFIALKQFFLFPIWLCILIISFLIGLFGMRSFR